MANTPLYTALTAHREAQRSSFHTPGHKCAPSALPADLLSLDLTELPDTDSLYEADGPIAAAEQKAAQLFQTRRTLFSAGGCSLCIQAMLFLAAPQGGTVIFDRILHRSAVNAMALLDITPVWVAPRADAGKGLPGRMHPDDVATALKKHPDARAVFVTSPDYYGVLADIPALSSLCRNHGVPLLVDNAHGSHLRFMEHNLHPAALGASAVACSAHKTLPVLTGGAWLHLQDETLADGAKEAMALFGSTSPSYPIMASLDLARDWLEREGQAAFGVLVQRVAAIRLLAEQLGISSPLGLCDPARLTFCTADLGIPGTEAAAHFRAWGVEPEYADGAYLVLIPSPFNTEADFARVEAALQALPKRAPLPVSAAIPALPQAELSPRRALFAARETIPLAHSAGRIAAETACPCPPGVPIVMPGEKIAPEIIDFLRRYGFFSIKVVK